MKKNLLALVVTVLVGACLGVGSVSAVAVLVAGEPPDTAGGAPALEYGAR